MATQIGEWRPPDPLKEIKTGFEFVRLLTLIAAFSVAVFLRRPGTAGDRWVGGLKVMFSLLYLLALASMFPPGEGGGVLAAIMFLFLLMCLTHRFWHDPLEHGQYGGISWMGRNDARAKGKWEMTLAFCLAILALPLPGLAVWLGVGAIGLAAEFSFEQWRVKAIQRAARDARIRQDYYAGAIEDGQQ